MSKILQTLEKKASSLTEEDIETWVADQLVQHYDTKITNLAHYTFREQGDVSKVALNAFKARAKEELISASKTFFLKKEHWKNGRDVNPYLRTCLNYLSLDSYWNDKAGQKMSSPVCPACKFNGNKEVCEKQNQLLRCFACTKEADRLKDELKQMTTEDPEYSKLQIKQRFHKMFALHSRKGRRCPDCNRFIPNSIITKSVVCPYSDCWFVGQTDQIDEVSHPVGVYARPLISIDKNIGSNSDNALNGTLHDFFRANEVTPDAALEMQDRVTQEHKVLKQVISDQVNRVKRLGSSGTKQQKLMMYEAFSNMLDRYPEEMISYLVHLKQNADFPIQARIFQEYGRLVEDALPLTITKYGNDLDILSLTDPDLALYLGQSEFEAEVDDNNLIPNLTKEEYIGGRKFKNHGRCFIGRVINIQDELGNSLLQHMKEYSFVQIKMSKEVKPGTKVLVKHFRILPHYEMHSLVYLQRIRKLIVDKTYFRLYKKKRKYQR